MPFIPAIIGAVVEVAADVAGTAAAAAGADAAATAATVGADTAATVGADAAATGASVGAEAGEVGAEAGEVGGEIGGEVGGEGTSAARNVADIGKQVFKGAKKADDIMQHLNNNNNSNNNNGSPGNVGVHPLSSAIDSISDGSSVGDDDSSYQNPVSIGQSHPLESLEPERGPIEEAQNIGVGPEEDSGYLADVGPAHGSGNMRI